MIDHLFIKNYKAFDRQNIPLDKNTLFIGTNNSGKSTISQNCFFPSACISVSLQDKMLNLIGKIIYLIPSLNIPFTNCSY